MTVALWPEAKYMRWRDVIRSADYCEAHGIGEPKDGDYPDFDVVVKDGGDGQQLNAFVQENRRRLNRVEDRLARVIQILLALTVTILGGIAVAVFVAAVL